MVRRWWWPPFPPWNGAANTARARRPKRQRSTNCTTFGRAHRAMRVEIAEGSPPTDVSERVGGAKSHRRPGADHVGPGNTGLAQSCSSAISRSCRPESKAGEFRGNYCILTGSSCWRGQQFTLYCSLVVALLLGVRTAIARGKAHPLVRRRTRPGCSTPRVTPPRTTLEESKHGAGNGEV